MSYKAINEAARKAAITLAACAGLVASDNLTKPSGAEAGSISSQEKNFNEKVGAVPGVRFRAAGEGKDYKWGKDHIFVKLTSAETGGILTLIQDNLKPGFGLGMHFHRAHTEIFYILEGSVEFETDKTSFTAKTGSVVYLPAGTPHAARSSTGGRMLMFYAPGGFDKMLAEIENASWLQRLNPIARARRDAKYDFNKGVDNASVDANAPTPVFVNNGERQTISQASGGSTVKLSAEETAGLATMIEETLKPGVERVTSLPSNLVEILYVLDGEFEFSIAGKTQTASAGATLYLPVGVRATVKSSAGARVMTYRTPGAE